MTSQITDFGVHDHGFNIVSTYGNLWRLAKECRIAESAYERRLYEMALRASGAVQANRWTDLGTGRRFIYSFNGSTRCLSTRSARYGRWPWLTFSGRC